MDRLKARLVAKGSTQMYDSDYYDQCFKNQIGPAGQTGPIVDRPTFRFSLPLKSD